MRVTTGTASNKAILQAFMDRVWSSGEIEAVDEYLAPLYTIHHDTGDPWEDKSLTPEEFKERVQISRSAAPDQTFTILEMIEEGDRIAATWDWHGTHSGDWPGLPAMGRRISMFGATIYYFKGSKISGHWQMADRMAVYMQAQDAGG